MRTRSTLLGVVAVFTVMGSGCGGSTNVQQDAGPPDETPPAIALSLGRYDVVKGTHALGLEATDDVAVVRTELLVDGVKVAESTQEPFALEWDTAAVADGVREVQVSAYDAAGNRGDSDAVPVFVVNAGATVVFDEAPELLSGLLEDTFTVPSNWNGNNEIIDLKYHWTMPAGMTRMVTVVMWDAAQGANLVYSTGTGWCPDSGDLLEEKVENDGEIVLEHEPGAALAEVDWFVHVGAANAADMKGQGVPFKLRVALFQ